VSASAPEAPLSEGGLRWGTIFAYAIPDGAVHYLYLLLVLGYTKYATDELGIEPATVGWIWLVSKVWDAISDPLVGQWSDSTQSRFGRRRPWLIGSAIPLSLTALALWAPPDLGESEMIGWVSLSFLAFFTAYTAFEVPHLALGAELSQARIERNRIFGVRQVVSTLGMFGAAVFGVEYALQGRAEAGGQALIAGLMVAILVVAGLTRLPPERVEFQGRSAENPWRAVSGVFRNPHARLLLFVFFIESLGSGGIGMLVPFVTQYVLKMPDVTGEMLAFYMVPTLLAVPVWVWLARHFEKRRLWLVAMVMGGGGFGMIFWLEEGDWWFMAISGAIAGVAGACGNTLGQALKADVIDFDEHLTGERKEGSYFATWNFVKKLASGVTGWLVGMVLSAVDYVPNATEQTQLVQDAMRFLMGGLPLLGYAIGVLAFTRFRFSEADHARIVEELNLRESDGT
jgi:GPH family glycoside/pentoside/hexuronide:cation symporter